MRTPPFILSSSALFLAVAAILIWFPNTIWAVDYICVLFAALFVAWFFTNEPKTPGGRKR